MDWKRVLRIAGIVVFVIGVVLGGIQIWHEMMTYATGVFATIVSDMPTQTMPLDCPAALAVGEPGTLVAKVPNRTGQTMGYAIHLDVHGLDAGVVSPAECDQRITLSPDEQAKVECTLRFNKVPEASMYGEAGMAYMRAWAFSDEDEATGEVFHPWRSSYQGWCMIEVTDTPGLTGRQVITRRLLAQRVPVALILLAGYDLWVWGCWPLKRRHLFLLIPGGLLVLASLVWVLIAVL